MPKVLITDKINKAAGEILEGVIVLIAPKGQLIGTLWMNRKHTESEQPQKEHIHVHLKHK